MDFKQLIARAGGGTPASRFRVAAGAVAVAAFGLLIWKLPAGAGWTNASYDWLFRFTSRGVTNRVAIIRMDNASHSALGQARGQRWDRALHARLLNRLKDDGCALVIMDVFFRTAGSAEADAALATALRRPGKAVLMAKVLEEEHPGLDGVKVELPDASFLHQAAHGIGRAEAELGEIVRRHWPFPAPQSGFPSLGWTAAGLAGANLPEEPVEQWLRYYAEGAGWESYSYHLALDKPRGHFKDTVVFIGSWPEHEGDPRIVEEDKFQTPQSSREQRAVGGVEIMATTFLNLMNRDWLRRTPVWVEAGVLLFGGLLLGGLAGCNWRAGLWVSILAGVAVFVGAVWMCSGGSYWFPWLIIAGALVPGAIGVSLVVALVGLRAQAPVKSGPTGTVIVAPPDGPLLGPGEPPPTPDYTFIRPSLGKGAFGEVWLVRNAIGQWQALKVVYQATFGQNTKPYDAEFQGLQRYKPVSNQHLGLLTVDFVSAQHLGGYFYYVMELGDSCVPDWESDPSRYKPLDLTGACASTARNRLPISECVRIGIVLADALAFLHDQELTHRDIKPSNIIFVEGRPKLADVGLVTAARRPELVTTYAGTPGYMPPPPEPTGTKQADIYAFGMVLYVISTGQKPAYFPDLKTSLVMDANNAEFMFLNPVILKACDTDLSVRYASAGELKKALEEVAGKLAG